MARAGFVVGFVTGAAVVIFGFAALGLHADEASAEVLAAAAAAHVDPIKLEGALNSLNMGGLEADPYAYLRSTGELPPASQTSLVARSAAWDRLADCESNGNWHVDGRTYSGGLQFDAPTWASYGGLAYAARAAAATRAQQIAVAERLRADRGFAPWPVCSRVVGLR